MKEKLCPRCKISKPHEDFGYRIRKRKTGIFTNVHSWCKLCQREDGKLRARRIRSTPEGRARLRDIVYRHREANGGRKAERDRSKVVFEGQEMTHREMVDIKRHRREELRKQKAAQKAEQKETRRIKREQEMIEIIKIKPWLNPKLTPAEKYRLRYALDEEFNIKERLRAAQRRKRQGCKLGDLIRDALNRDGRSLTFEEFVGYTTADLKKHLELQFIRGMNWEKFRKGKIHIDHIVPLDAFNLHDSEEVRKAWAITNLRPSWASDNLQKSNKREFLI